MFAVNSRYLNVATAEYESPDGKKYVYLRAVGSAAGEFCHPAGARGHYVTCPTMRYHPAVVAQKAATLQLLADGRFTLGLGAGENLNEHVIGEGWPNVDTRQAMLAEAMHIIRELHTGELVSFRGDYFDIDSASIWDLPDGGVPIGVAAGGPSGRGARAAGRPPHRHGAGR